MTGSVFSTPFLFDKNMVDLNSIDIFPTMEDFDSSISNELFESFCSYIQSNYKVQKKIEFSRCTLAYGWNIKFKKGSRSICTIYPHKSFFTVLIVISTREKESVENILSSLSKDMQELYKMTKEGNGQRWLMMDIHDDNDFYSDMLTLIDIRYKS